VPERFEIDYTAFALTFSQMLNQVSMIRASHFCRASARRGCSRLALTALVSGFSLFLLACQNTRSGAALNLEDNRELSEATASSAVASESERQTAYRIREDFDLSLNSEAGWAAAINSLARVTADEPFRIRFEVEAGAPDTEGARYRLQYRRNKGVWKALLAENFPQPSKTLVLDFESKPAAPLTDLWSIVEGPASALTWLAGDESGYLRMAADDEPVLTLSRSSAHWEPVEFAVKLRLPGDSSTRAGIVFAYDDALNHRRLEVDTSGRVAVVHVEDGQESVFVQHQTEPVLDRFVELKVIREGRELIVEFDDEALVFSASYDQAFSFSNFGLYLPGRGSVDLKSVEVEGLPRSPRTSIIASDQFEHGAPTKDLLSRSKLPFSAGAGISFADTTPLWFGADSHGEWEFPVVIRYFSDGAAMNVGGDVFEYRLVNAAGDPVATEHYATVILEVADGHLGGTFVETPMRIGPWQAADGSLYFLMEPSETWNSLMVVKSVDGGRSWSEADGANRPSTGDLEGFASRSIGAQIHMLHQTSDDVVYHVFRTSDHPEYPDTWAIQDEWLASPVEPPTQVADLELRSDGSVVAVYGGQEKIHYQIRSASGRWNEAIIIDAEESPDLSGPTVVRGPDDVVHLAYTGKDGSAWYRQILPSGELTKRMQFASGLGTTSDDAGSILPLVYLKASDEVVLLYRLATGQLWERRVRADGQWTSPIRVTDRRVVQNAVDAEQTGADAIGFENSVNLLFIEEGTGRLYHTARVGEGDWSEPVLVVGDEKVQWVRGSLIRGKDDQSVYAYVYDGGADGGSGKNQFGQILLEVR
jgi:hypothetical protein